MLPRSSIPDTFFYRGRVLNVPLEHGDTEVRWLERLAFVLEFLRPGDSDDRIERLVEDSRKDINVMLLGVIYSDDVVEEPTLPAPVRPNPTLVVPVPVLPTPVVKPRPPAPLSPKPIPNTAPRPIPNPQQRPLPIKALTMREAVDNRITVTTKLFQQGPQNFQRFMYWLNNVTYIRYMGGSGRYTARDIMEYNVAKHFEEAVILNLEEAIQVFYSFYKPDRTPNNELMAILAERYRGSYVYMFQMLYRKYVNPDHELDKDPNSYINIMIQY